MPGLHRKRKPTSTADFDAMLLRMLRAYGKRVGQDPAAALDDLRAIEATLTDSVNAGIATANRDGGHSINELAAILGMSKQGVAKRVALGMKAAEPVKPPRLTGLRRARPRELDAGNDS